MRATKQDALPDTRATPHKYQNPHYTIGAK